MELKPNPVQTRKPFFGRWAMISMAVLIALMAVGYALLWSTDDALTSMPFLKQRGAVGALANRQKTLVDETPWSTAQAAAAMAVSQEEHAYAREAERLADHDVDQAFAGELRKAGLKQRTLSANALAAQKHEQDLEATVASDQQAVDDLHGKAGDDLDVAQAQLNLDKDELQDAKDDFARASGDQRVEIQQELNARNAEMKKFDAAGGSAEVAVVSVQRYKTLAGLIEAWQRQTERTALLQQAKAATEADAARHAREHGELEAQSTAAAAATGAGAAANRVAGLKLQSLRRQLMSIYDDRVDTETQLAKVYDKWIAQVALQRRIVEHFLVAQCMGIVAILIVAIALNAAVRRFSEREGLDLRRMRTMIRVSRLVIQVMALLAILLVIFGKPDQLSTVIGLTTAGLTVALQDFILAFVGWFILMGRNGIGVGDVVEIDGVAGEVTEIGLFRTTLLETGNWTAKGHPTGRHVAFNNKYAISGKFFNFSTSGQWMWDELTVSIPENDDTYPTIERVHDAVVSATEEDAKQAEIEWRNASAHHALSQFTADPDVNVRPSASGVDLVVRYVTRASGRFEQRNRLYQCVLDAVHPKSDSEKA